MWSGFLRFMPCWIVRNASGANTLKLLWPYGGIARLRPVASSVNHLAPRTQTQHPCGAARGGRCWSHLTGDQRSGVQSPQDQEHEIDQALTILAEKARLPETKLIRPKAGRRKGGLRNNAARKKRNKRKDGYKRLSLIRFLRLIRTTLAILMADFKVGGQDE